MIRIPASSASIAIAQTARSAAPWALGSALAITLLANVVLIWAAIASRVGT